MDLEERYRLAVVALERIATFGHLATCESSAPVHECGCYDQDEKEIAAACLEEIDE